MLPFIITIAVEVWLSWVEAAIGPVAGNSYLWRSGLPPKEIINSNQTEAKIWLMQSMNDSRN